MQKKRFQNIMAESRWSLPTMFALAALVWVFVGLGDTKVWPCLALTAIATMFMADLNNTNSLIRIYSRMVSCSFIALITMAPSLFPSLQMSVVTLCTVGFFTSIFRCYQDSQSPGWVFYAFLCVGLASLVWVQTLFFVPFLWLLMATPLFCMSFRVFVASILGITLPYWFMLGYCALAGDITFFVEHFLAIAKFSPLLDISGRTVMDAILLGIVVICALIGGFHFLTNEFADKIRTRVYYRFFILIDLAALAFLVLQPQHFAPLWGIMVVCTAPLIGHFIALTRGRWSAYTTYSLMAAVAVLVLYNLWPLLQNYL